MIDHYDWAGGREAMMRFGPADGPVVVPALPLFEEANRTRTFAVGMLRKLAERGIGSVLPDLPGTGESLVLLRDVTVLRMREAFAAVVDHLDRPTIAVGIRSGTLIDALALASGRWHLAPTTGEAVIRELVRIKNAEGGGERYDVHTIIGVDEPVEIAGNALSGEMLADLLCCSPFDRPGSPRRVVRLETDPRPADRKVPGGPLWRRAEPGDDPALAEMLADDLAAWVRQCVG
jgi:hypothetical protein